MNFDDLKNPGGTDGGILMFAVGLLMAIAGGYLLLDRVVVTSGFWSYYGHNLFGLTFLPLIIGIALLFFNGRSIIGWILAAGSVGVIGVGLIANLTVIFQPTSAFSFAIMLILFAGGLGLIARSLFSFD